MIVVGAGAAGLAALRELDRAGIGNTLCLEARDRVGGRIFSIRDPLSPSAIELGAEFIHGDSSEIWAIVHAAQLTVYDCGDTALRVQAGKVQTEHAWDLVGEVMDGMQKAAADGPDQSFADFLATSHYSDEAKRWATGYVEGFNASRQEVVSIQALSQEAQASDEISGDQAFRFANGYDAVPLHLLRSVNRPLEKLRLNSAVERIDWARGSVAVHARHVLSGEAAVFRARAVIVTLPLGVLQANTVQFHPEPVSIFQAVRALAFGQVFRVTFRFRQPFWESRPDLSLAGFLLSDEKLFPTWWTSLALRAPVITGWSAGPHADDLIGKTREQVIAEALASLSRITGTPHDEVAGLVEAAYFHDWHSDVFACGAYSYVPAGAMELRKPLAEPVESTLFFAGEATEIKGHCATVHGALATGIRAARQVIEALEEKSE